MHYVGMYCHITTLDFLSVKADSVAISVNGLMEFVKTMPSLRTIGLEKGAPSFHRVRI